MTKTIVTTLIAILILGFAFTLPVTKTDFVIEGIVTDTNQQPIAGARVEVPGTKFSTSTDPKGKFKLTVTESCVPLDIIFIAHKKKSLKEACSGTVHHIQLTPLPKEKVIEELIDMDQEQPAANPIPYTSSEESSGPPAPVTRPRSMKKDGQGNAYTLSNRRLTPKTMGRGQYKTVAPYDPGTPHNTEDYSVINENQFYAVQQEPLSTFSIDVDAASYSNLRRFLTNGQKPYKDAVRIEEMVNYFNYDYPQPSGEDPFEIVTEMSECPWQPRHQLLHIGLQGKAIPYENLPASNLVFLLDVSGSMNAPNKLPLLQSSFKLLVDQLRPQDKVAIVVYAGSSGVVLPATSGDHKQKIKEAIQQLQAGGSTAGAAGINLAYKIARENFVQGGNNRVILATDGDFNIGVSSDAELVRIIEKERESGVFLTVLGFGTGNYKDNKMQQLADKGNGNHAYIDNISEARKVLVSEFGGTVFAIAKDVKLQIEFNPAYVAGYRLIGYENRVLQNEDFNDDKKDAGELGSGHTVTALYEIIPAGTESTFLKSVDPLKYQEKVNAPSTGADTKEVVHIKFRYKKPDGDTSKLIEKAVKMDNKRKTSDNFRWSAAVAEFGMLLRDSEFRQEASYQHVLELARGAKGEDKEGYRAEFIKMVTTMRDLEEPTTAGK